MVHEVKITRISVYQMNLPLKDPYWLSGGRLKFESLDTTFLKIETDEGLTGWGEGCPWGHTYLPAHGPGTRAAIQTMAPFLMHLDPRNLDAINRTMDLNLPGHLYAKSPVDMACWDIAGQAAGMPLWQMFGGNQAGPVHLNSSISTASAAQMISAIEKSRADGFRTHSAKVGGIEAGAEIQRMETICDALKPDERVTFDVNRAWSTGTALQVLNGMSTLTWVEQPCETVQQCALVQGHVRQPLVLDECLLRIEDHLYAWKENACAGIKIKPNRVGGLSKARFIRDFALEVGWEMHIEDTGGSSLADTAAIHLAASTPDEYRMDSWIAHYHLANDPLDGNGLIRVKGQATAPSIPGLGAVPDEKIFGTPVAVYDGSL